MDFIHSERKKKQKKKRDNKIFSWILLKPNWCIENCKKKIIFNNWLLFLPDVEESVESIVWISTLEIEFEWSFLFFLWVEWWPQNPKIPFQSDQHSNNSAVETWKRLLIKFNNSCLHVVEFSNTCSVQNVKPTQLNTAASMIIFRKSPAGRHYFWPILLIFFLNFILFLWIEWG